VKFNIEKDLGKHPNKASISIVNLASENATEVLAHAEASAAIVDKVDAGPFDRLTPRELSVALRLAAGDRTAEIAEALDISPKTVDTHRANVLKKLSLRHNVDIARAAIKAGLVAL
jgi:DNA-binding NarL/FixJ family response regulator